MRSVFGRVVGAAFAVAPTAVVISCGDSGLNLPVVAMVVIHADSTRVEKSGTLQLTAETRTSQGTSITGGQVQWQSSNDAVATVDGSGLVTGISTGNVTITVSIDGVTDIIEISVTPRPFRFTAIAAGGSSTCGIATDTKTYCWGGRHFDSGLFGPVPIPTEVPGPAFDTLGASDTAMCGLTVVGDAHCWGSSRSGLIGGWNYSAVPMAVEGGLKFREVSGGIDHMCGRTTTDQAYCWGSNSYGQLGIGSFESQAAVPTSVVGDLRFTQVSVGTLGVNTCGLTVQGKAYCWGYNFDANLGDSTSGNRRYAPVAVAGGHVYRKLAGAQSTTCALKGPDEIYCWGPRLPSGKPYGAEAGIITPVLDARAEFMSIHVTGGAACGLDATRRAWCWGANSGGNLGDGTTESRSEPTAVVGSHEFIGFAMGDAHTCGIVSDGRAFCWGANAYGQLGDGTTTSRPFPAPLAPRP